MLTLITGGARSGKSTFAQSLCSADERVTYLATASITDEEMRERIARHRQTRPPSWVTVEETMALSSVVREHAAQADFVLIDCLTLWLSNMFFEYRDEHPAAVETKIREQATQVIQASKLGNVIAVTNEVGSGVVPESPVGRRFRDLQGFVNQQFACAADAVYLLVSGIPMRIKPALAAPLNRN